MFLICTGLAQEERREDDRRVLRSSYQVKVTVRGCVFVLVCGCVGVRERVSWVDHPKSSNLDSELS